MSKSGQYNLSEIEKRDALIQELLEALEAFTGWVHDNQEDIAWTDSQSLVGIMDKAIEVLAKTRGEGKPCQS